MNTIGMTVVAALAGKAVGLPGAAMTATLC
jgi:hypothetical protein